MNTETTSPSTIDKVPAAQVGSDGKSSFRLRLI